MKRLTIGADACTETLALLITMAWADGHLDEKEKASVLAAAGVFNLTKELRDRIDQILEKPMPVEELLVESLSARDKSFAVVAAAWMSGVDSEVDEKEQQLLDKAADVWSKAEMIVKVKEPIASEYPLMREGQAIGAIFAGRYQAKTFLESEVALLETFAAQAVIAIENARLFREQREAVEQLTATAEVLEIVSKSPTDT